MIHRINYPIILFIITQFFLLQNLHAETPHASSAENSQVITPLENTHQVAAYRVMRFNNLSMQDFLNVAPC